MHNVKSRRGAIYIKGAPSGPLALLHSVGLLGQGAAQRGQAKTSLFSEFDSAATFAPAGHCVPVHAASHQL